MRSVRFLSDIRAGRDPLGDSPAPVALQLCSAVLRDATGSGGKTGLPLGAAEGCEEASGLWKRSWMRSVRFLSDARARRDPPGDSPADATGSGGKTDLPLGAAEGCEEVSDTNELV